MKTVSKSWQRICAVAVVLFGSLGNIFFSTMLHNLLSTRTLLRPSLTMCLESLQSSNQHLKLFLVFEGILAAFALFVLISNFRPYESDQMKVTDTILTPVPVGQGQHGTARWMTDKEKEKTFTLVKLPGDSRDVHPYLDFGDQRYQKIVEAGVDILPAKVPPAETVLFSEGGIVLGRKVIRGTEYLYLQAGPIHTIIIGATGSGKTRRILLQSVCAQALAGESMITSDPKGEMYHYTKPLLESLGYEVIAVDFADPRKSHGYNPLQPIIDAVGAGEIDKAETAAWDLTNNLVGKPTGEKIWSNGEMSIIAAAILCVVCDNMGDPEYQNLTNVYHFIANMCKPAPGKNGATLLTEYVKTLPQAHPARALLGISSVAPARTAGSFYTSALTTLRLFTARDIYAMTSHSSFKLDDVGQKKQALFMILPDERTVFYPIATILVSQQYEHLVRLAKRMGNRLPLRVNYNLEEFGNFAPIADFTNKLTVARGYEIRFNLVIQSFAQLEEKYGKDAAKIIKGNCLNWIYLATTDPETKREFSESLGKYTTSSYSLSSQNAKFSNPSRSTSVNLIARSLLEPDEVGHIEAPYALVASQAYPAMMQVPDLSEWLFNRMMGLGDKVHNSNLIMASQARREDRNNTSREPCIWTIWQDLEGAVAPASGPIFREAMF